jgi:hypothetical protein
MVIEDRPKSSLSGGVDCGQIYGAQFWLAHSTNALN